MFKLFPQYSVLECGISEVGDGSMSLSAASQEEIERNEDNRTNFFQKKGAKQLVLCRSIHGAVVKAVTKTDSGKILPETDGLITREPGLFLSLTVADCVPVYLFNPKNSVIGLIHCGWRGVAAGIVGNTVRLFDQKFGSRPQDLLAGLGPSVKQHHYEIQSDVAKIFAVHADAILERSGKFFLDLPRVIELQLKQCKLEKVEQSTLCTFCEEKKYFSHRREKITPPKTMIAYIALL